MTRQGLLVERIRALGHLIEQSLKFRGVTVINACQQGAAPQGVGGGVIACLNRCFQFCDVGNGRYGQLVTDVEPLVRAGQLPELIDGLAYVAESAARPQQVCGFLATQRCFPDCQQAQEQHGFA